ncbi:hypothetical protein CHLRE_09g399073v5 [Chlamydomonas reinhardtii]|uniref:SGNH hydrolase-type esterase domain-containing protein n=1 Tax=Chlamydomonas reinhardtii TaxID=3055 RepID=A0A2K3DCZ8_CHLRE|nr:uncharacterized protein CHLRE_09g399073v5 [Chlamydomonas reinhardtii]PNW78398.1 hypothetical protein CHLRE_09g399073v5 [Chlamydomonas reinhardtii]
MLASVTPGAAAAPTSAGSFVAAARPRIILFGDSLTERGFDQPGGWAAYMAANYTRRADVVNRGMSGYNTRWAVQVLPYVFGQPTASAGSGGSGGGAGALAGQVLFATLFFGANDAARKEGPEHSARQHVPVDEYGRNLREMVSYMRATGISRILLLTPPPVWAPGRRKHMLWRVGEASKDWPLDRTQEATQPYARAAAEAAQELGVPCLDLNTLLQQEEDWGERLLCDGLHLTPTGQEKLWSLVREAVWREWPETRPEALKTQFPAWDAIDFADIASSFLPQGEQQGQDGAAKEKAGGKAAAAAAAGVANGAKA